MRVDPKVRICTLFDGSVVAMSTVQADLGLDAVVDLRLFNKALLLSNKVGPQPKLCLILEKAI